MTILRGPVLLVVASFAVLSLSGCTKTIKESDVESKVAQNLEGQLKGTKVTVDCPGGKEAKKGTAFTCKATIGGRPAAVDIRLVDDSGKFSFVVHSAGTTP